MRPWALGSEAHPAADQVPEGGQQTWARPSGAAAPALETWRLALSWPGAQLEAWCAFVVALACHARAARLIGLLWGAAGQKLACGDTPSSAGAEAPRGRPGPAGRPAPRPQHPARPRGASGREDCAGARERHQVEPVHGWAAGAPGDNRADADDNRAGPLRAAPSSRAVQLQQRLQAPALAVPAGDNQADAGDKPPCAPRRQTGAKPGEAPRPYPPFSSSPSLPTPTPGARPAK